MIRRRVAKACIREYLEDRDCPALRNPSLAQSVSSEGNHETALFRSQGLHGIDGGGAAGGDIAGRKAMTARNGGTRAKVSASCG
jgi:hypothetical protein